MKKHFLITLFTGLIAGFAGAWLFIKIASLPEQEQTLFQISDTDHTSYPVDLKQQITGRQIAEHTFEASSFHEAATASTASVVFIKTTALNQRSVTWLDLFFDNEGRYNRVSSSGSGVIFSSDGYVVTNNHVIANATEIEVIHNRRTYKADVIGVDPSSDLALLKIEGRNLPAIKIGSSEKVRVGDWVLAVGNPFNLTSTVTAGIVSAKGRNINILSAQFPIESFIQTDAAINPGNSGGALVNTKGELVGINTAILSRTGSYSGYGFAVPSDIVVKVINDLKNFGQTQKAFVGAEVSDVSEELYKKLNLEEISGVIILQIDAEGALDKAGLRAGDVIVKINDKEISSKVVFDEQLSYFSPGDRIKVQYKREGKAYEKTVELTNIDGSTQVFRKQVFRAEQLGADLELVPKLERSRLKIDNGVRFLKIYDRGIARRMGFQEGFIITAINNRTINTPEELASILERVRGSIIIRGVSKEGVPKEYYLY